MSRLRPCPRRISPRDPQDSGIKRYSDAAAHYATWREQALRIADTFMRAVWCARRERRVDEERALLREATRWFTKALDGRTVESDQRATVIYLAGEVYRRCGEFAGAESLFEQARTDG